jgi:hypothetical protein
VSLAFAFAFAGIVVVRRAALVLVAFVLAVIGGVGSIRSFGVALPLALVVAFTLALVVTLPGMLVVVRLPVGLVMAVVLTAALPLVRLGLFAVFVFAMTTTAALVVALALGLRVPLAASVGVDGRFGGWRVGRCRRFGIDGRTV